MDMGRPALNTIDVATPERLLNAAEDVFASQGVDAARLQDIAEQAGITRPALLYHFTTKDSLYTAVVERAFASLSEILISAMQAHGEFRDKFRALIEGFLTFVEVHPSLARVLVRELLSDRRELLERHAAPLLDAVVEFVEREGGHALRKDIPVRAALMQIVSDVFLRSAAGDLRAKLWGDVDATWSIASALLLPEPERRQQAAALRTERT
jgi:AcrR family transcriptional regulator